MPALRYGHHGAGSWWTGKDSNLRSPQGAADLQSAGFNHSPTRPPNAGHQQSVPFQPKRVLVGSGVRGNTKGTCVQRHQPVLVAMTEFAPPHSPVKSWWSWRRDLNPRPSDYKSDALPAELRQRRSNRTRIADSAPGLQGTGQAGKARFKTSDCGKEGRSCDAVTVLYWPENNIFRGGMRRRPRGGIHSFPLPGSQRPS